MLGNDSKKTTPLIDKISRIVRQDIVSHGYKVGDKLPPVTELATKYEVSDRTIQLAMNKLKKDGILSSHVGKGTFLNRLPIFPGTRTDGIKTSEFEQFSNTIAVLDGQSEVDLTCEHTESWTTRIVHGMRVEAAANHLDLLLLNDPLKIDALTERLSDMGSKVDGIITFPFTDNYSMLELFDKSGLPVLMINRPCSESQYNYVTADYFEGSKLVGQLFAEIGAKKIWLVTTQMAGIYSKEQRYKGLAEGLKLAGCNVEVEIILIPSATDISGYKGVIDRFRGGEHPEAIYCSGDYIAIGVMGAARDAGLQIGTEGGVSIIGSTGLELCNYTNPSLSVVQIPMIEMGRRAVKRVLEMRAEHKTRCTGDILPVELILRGSTPLSLIEKGWLNKTKDTKTLVFM